MSRACPGPADLQAIADGRPVAGDVAAHVLACRQCATAIEEMRSNEAFLRDASPALRGAWEREHARPRRREGEPPRERSLVAGYELVEEISRGGQGVVYRAVQSATRRTVALKMLLMGSLATERQRDRFDREIELAARLRHPGLVTVFESGAADDGTRYVAMEFVEGVPLDEHVRVRQIAGPSGAAGARAWIREVLVLFQKIAAAVGHAHSAGVIHRDLKPANIMVDTQGNPRVLDFGIARAAESAGDTLTHEFVGTPAYAAPEQFEGDASAVSARTDVYALGVIMYRVLTGAPPYPCDGPLADVIRHVTGTEPVPPSRRSPRLAGDVETIILACLAKDPRRRYSTAAALAADIEDSLAGRPISARLDSTVYVLSRLARKHRVVAAAGAILLVTTAVAAVVLALMAGELERQRLATYDALVESSVQRARLLGATGERRRAERLLWQFAPHDPGARGPLGFETSFEHRRSSWALMEFYSRIPRLMRVGVDATIAGVSIDGSVVRGTLWNAARRTWSLDGRTLDAGPPLPLTPFTWRSMNAAGSRVASLHADGTIHVVDRDAGPIGSVRAADHAEQAAAILGVDLSPDRRWVCWWTAETIHVRRADALDAGTTIHDAGAPLSRCEFSHDGRWLLAGAGWGVEASIRAWSIGDWSERQPFPWVGGGRPSDDRTGIHVMATDAAGRWLAATIGGSLALWDFDRPDNGRVLGTHRGPLRLLRFAADGRHLLSGSDDGEIKVWRLPGGEQVASLTVGQRPSVIDVSSDLAHIAVGEAAVSPLVSPAAQDAAAVSVYELRPNEWLARRSTDGAGVTHALAVGPGDAAACWGDMHGTLWRLDDAGGVHPLATGAHAGGIGAIDWTPDGSRIISAGLDGVVHELDAATGRTLRTLFRAPCRLWSVRVSPDGAWACFAGDAPSVWVCDLSGGPGVTEIAGHRNRVPKVAISPDGRRIASASADGTAIVRRTSDWSVEHHLVGHLGPVRAVAFSPDGTALATGADDQTARLWDLRTGRVRAEFEGLPGHCFDLEFHPSGSVVFAVTREGVLVVIDAERATELATFRVHANALYAVRAFAGGTRLATVGEDPGIGVWDLAHLGRYVTGNAGYWRRAPAGVAASRSIPAPPGGHAVRP